MDYYLLLTIILILSFIQSILGIGLLVLGTPTLILLGFSLFETMAIILPSSIIISSLQILDSDGDYKKFKVEFLIYCLPSVFIGLIIIMYLEGVINFKLLVGIMLLLSGLMRFKKNFLYINEAIINRKKEFLVFIGLMHGLTNMGGGFLALFSSVIFGDKKLIRSSIAYGYLFMCLLQYIFLLLFIENTFRSDIFLFMLISTLSYYFLGKPFFAHITNNFFQKFITYMILLYGLIVIINQLHNVF